MRHRLATLALVVIAGFSMAPMTQAQEPPAQEQTARCQEDEPCWDCRTMGNRRCGPSRMNGRPWWRA